MVVYLAKVREAMKKFKGVRMEQVPREKNQRADVLAKIAVGERHALLRGVPLQLIPRSSITKAVEVLPISRPHVGWTQLRITSCKDSHFDWLIS